MKRPRDLRPAWAAIDLDALARNAARLGDRGVALRAVLKADAYGHGAAGVGGQLASRGVDRFAVALVEEGAELRRGGLAGDILVMGPSLPEQCEALARHDLVVTLSGPEQLSAWTGWSSGSGVQRVHLKVNTGMNRLGLAPGEVADALAAVRAHPELELAGLMSHFSSADELEDETTSSQTGLFKSLLELLTADERQTIEIHIANSAGLLHGGGGPANVARPGLALLGYDPARHANDLEPVMSVVARISQIQTVRPGDRVGYGGRWRSSRDGRIGIVPVGYADGFPWRLGNRCEVLVEGRRVPVVGAVSMDMLALDLSQTSAGVGSEVVLLGEQGSQRVGGFELADRAGTVIYEVLCGFGLRLPKVYSAAGVEPWTVSRFLRSAG